MTLTRNLKQTVVDRVHRDPAFAKALLDEAATLFLGGEPDAARLVLRDLVNATIGFDELAQLTQTFDDQDLSICQIRQGTSNERPGGELDRRVA